MTLSSNFGTVTLDFGAAPGTNVITANVTGETDIPADALVEAWLMTDSTADHNAYEHAVVPIKLACGSVVAGTGFTVTASTDWRLTGEFTARWVWTQGA